MPKTLRAEQFPVLTPALQAMFGSNDDPMDDVDRRGGELFPASPPIVWESDPTWFQFGFVGETAVRILGYPRERWLEPGFWVTSVVLEGDKDDALTYCLLATGKGIDHMFEYRARAADSRILWFRDYVKVVRSPAGRPWKLRGAMFDVTREKISQDHPVPERVPPRETLIA